MIKLIVSDFDGTLLPYGDDCLPPAALDALRAALDAGCTVALSSGRTYPEMLSYVEPLSDRLWFVCCDGAYTVKGGQTLYEKKIETEDLRFFFENAAKASTAFLLHAAEATYAVGEVPAKALPRGAVRISRVTEIPEKIFKITAFGASVKLPPYSGLRLHWDGGSAIAQYVNRFAHKGAALSDLQIRLILDKFDTAAIGDSDNDIAMMHGAKLSYAVGNRSAALSTVCNRHVATGADAIREILADQE